MNIAIRIATKPLHAVAASLVRSVSFTPFGTYGRALATFVHSSLDRGSAPDAGAKSSGFTREVAMLSFPLPTWSGLVY